MTTSERLRTRLKALGYEVYRPKRIWLGKGTDNGDWWRWQAGEIISGGDSKIGCNMSMQECLAMPDAELAQRIERNT